MSSWARALEQAARYQSLAGADKAFVVLPESTKNFEAKGVVSAEALVAAVKSFLEQKPKRRSKRIASTGTPCLRFDDHLSPIGS